jgi:3-hydroxyethyl bacteriochlorophyllide a dehydrogenase
MRATALKPLAVSDVRVDIDWSGISTGTEKLFWTGKMPNFPGMGYPLVPGYESVGRIVDAGADAENRVGEWVFVPGANCYRDARGLFGGSAKTVIMPSARALPISEKLGRNGILYALAATAEHALAGANAPDLIVGHGVLGRLIARLAVAKGEKPPTVWDTDARRHTGAQGYSVICPSDDDRCDYSNIYDVSGDASSIESFIGRLAKGGTLVLAGFYNQPISFAFPPAFQREARIRIAAEWQAEDLASINTMIDAGKLDLSDLITNVRPAEEAELAYPTAFDDAECLKMVLDWRDVA